MWTASIPHCQSEPQWNPFLAETLRLLWKSIHLFFSSSLDFWECCSQFFNGISKLSRSDASLNIFTNPPSSGILLLKHDILHMHIGLYPPRVNSFLAYMYSIVQVCSVPTGNICEVFRRRIPKKNMPYLWKLSFAPGSPAWPFPDMFRFCPFLSCSIWISKAPSYPSPADLQRDSLFHLCLRPLHTSQPSLPLQKNKEIFFCFMKTTCSWWAALH